MRILIESEFTALGQELKTIKELIGIENSSELLCRIQKIIERLEVSKQSRIKRAGLKLLLD